MVGNDPGAVFGVCEKRCVGILVFLRCFYSGLSVEDVGDVFFMKGGILEHRTGSAAYVGRHLGCWKSMVYMESVVNCNIAGNLDGARNVRWSLEQRGHS